MERLIGIDIFSGAGGMTLGAEKAGIKVVSAVENDLYSSQTYKYNHKSTHIIIEDIRKVDAQKTGFNPPFIVFGGPPCQGFSTSNTKTRNLDNPKNWMFKEFIRFIEVLKPVWFVFENVEGFKTFNQGSFVKELELNLINIGYNNIYSDILNASDFGVPQNRRRFFMAGNNKGIKFEFPVPDKHFRKITVYEALHDLPSLKNGDNFEELPYKTDNFEKVSSYAGTMRVNSKSSKQNIVTRNKDYVIDRYAYIKPGQNWEVIPKDLMKNYKSLDNCHSGIYKRLNPDEPSTAIANFRKNMLIHPFEDRGLSIREAARLQSFPDDFIFKGPFGFIQQQIGNAVPPLLAEAVFSHIIKLTFGGCK